MGNNNSKENVPIINNQSEYMDTYVENISCIIPFLHNNRYVDKVEEKMEVAEKEGKSKYTYLSDIEVIYHFVHLQKDMDEKKNRKEDTKKLCVRNLVILSVHGAARRGIRIEWGRGTAKRLFIKNIATLAYS